MCKDFSKHELSQFIDVKKVRGLLLQQHGGSSWATCCTLTRYDTSLRAGSLFSLKKGSAKGYGSMKKY